MDEAELEEWYQQERERLEERALDALQKGDTSAQARFDAAYRRLIAQYQRRQQSLYSSEVRREQIRKPVARVRQRLGEASQAPGAWLRVKAKELRKWLFDRKVRRLLRS